ncbi:MAG: hypothetical protein JRI23_36225 [Deltaproteobacteria bacterium]|jgi:hypothetical protein|nr:hypothetical protein [Deltaproteobacteria bacterium]MBW2537797.1 hypothetical protein [Deltaproteobacteria bacterium]
MLSRSSSFTITVRAPASLSVNSDTFHSIGVKWDLGAAEDADYDAVVSVRYRKQGAASWSDAADLLRNDYDWYWGTAHPRSGIPHTPTHRCFCGSIMFLTPGTTYEVELTYTDPGGADPSHGLVETFEATTRAIPIKPTGGRTLYCVAGSSGGDGSSGSPYQGIATASANATPGDIIKLRDTNGVFSRQEFNASGAEDNYIVLEPDAGHSPQLDGLIIGGDHVWVDKLSFVHDGSSGSWELESGIYVRSGHEPDDVVITDCSFLGYTKGSITASQPISRWVVIDNDVAGDEAPDCYLLPEPNTTDTWGIRVGGEGNPGGPGCVVAYNTVRRSIDGIDFGCNFASSNNDCYGNKVVDVRGNAFSCDDARENNRIYGNYIGNTSSYSLTWQPQRAGPWYWCYNQFVNQVARTHFKYRVQDRSVLIGNTFAGPGVGGQTDGAQIMRFLTRNNLWIKESSQLWNGITRSGSDIYRDTVMTAFWQTDVDYDGIDIGAGPTILRWFGNTTNYDDFASIYSDIGIWEHGVLVDADQIFVDKTYDDNTPLLLASGANAAVDAGQEVPNLADFYTGSAPDLGCHDRGNGAPHYGQRTSELGLPLHQRTEYWVKH